MAVLPQTADLAEKRRILQLETLHDLALALHAHRPEEQLVEELLQQVCAVLDPAAAFAVTRDPWGGPLATTLVGWRGRPPDGKTLLALPLWRELVAEGGPVLHRDGELAGRPYRELLASPLACRGVFLGYFVLLDKESRDETARGFSTGDRRFLDSVAALGGVALDSARQLAALEDQRERLTEENKALRGRLFDSVEGPRIIAHAPVMRQALEMVERVAPRSVNMLIRGESGTGKELIAKLAHMLSGREGALIAINCAALPESLLESELFGIEGGVATGVQARRGKFELAHRGTLFLDEIGDLHLPLQVKLLRALQEREVTRVGGHKSVPVDVRVVAATHRSLESMVEAGEFRGDLYYRLKGVDVELPPLRQRRQDIPYLVRHFTEAFCDREGLEPPGFSPDALSLLLAHDYPGNVRELQNLVESAVSLAETEVDGALVRSLVGGPGDSDGDAALDLQTVEKRHIERVLRLAEGNKSAAARMLGIDRRTLQRKGY